MSIEKSTQTLSEMLIQRGYKIIEQDTEKIFGQNDRDEQIVAFILPIAKFSVDRVKEYSSTVKKLNINRCVIQYIDIVTPMAKKVIENSVDIIIELFTHDELQFNITKHVLVPVHTKIPEKEADLLKKQFGLRFPTLLKKDAISRFLGFQYNDMIKITRKGGIVAYRIVR